MNSKEAKHAGEVINSKGPSSSRNAIRNNSQHRASTTVTSPTTSSKRDNTGYSTKKNNAEANRRAAEIATRANDSPFQKSTNQSRSQNRQDPADERLKRQFVDGLKKSSFKNGRFFDEDGKPIDVGGQATENLNTVHNRAEAMVKTAQSGNLELAYKKFQNLYNNVPEWKGFNNLPESYMSWTNEQKIAYSYLAELKYFEYVNTEANNILQKANELLRGKNATVTIPRKELTNRLHLGNSNTNTQNVANYVTEKMTTELTKNGKRLSDEEKKGIVELSQNADKKVKQRKEQLALLKDKIKASGCKDCPE